jgi:spermidine synthase
MINDDIKVTVVKSCDFEQLKVLYRASGWWNENNDNVDPDLIKKIVAGSFCFVIATIPNTHILPLISCSERKNDDRRIIGMGRAISDGVSDAYIQDVAVLPELRGNGIGILIMDEIIWYLKSKNINWISLISEPKAVSFYERYGFSLMKDYLPFTLK